MCVCVCLLGLYYLEPCYVCLCVSVCLLGLYSLEPCCVCVCVCVRSILS